MLSELSIAYALSFLGAPYKWGGQGPEGVDCSGLAVLVLQSEGRLPNIFDANSQGLYDYFMINKAYETSKPKPGCLAFYGKSLKQITHVAICLSETQIIEAAGGNSTTLTREDAAKRNAHVRIRPIHYRKDLVAIITSDINPNKVLPLRTKKKKE